MKKVFIISAIAFGSLIYKAADAQIGVSVGVGFAPRGVEVTDQQLQYGEQDDDYYYLPDVDAYYNVFEQCYYYFDGENWVSAAYLPGGYRDYDWQNAPHYEVRAVRPYLRDDFYRDRFHGRIAIDWRGRGYGNRPGDVYANRGYRNNDQHFDDRFREGENEQRGAREYRGGEQNFDNRRPDNSFRGEQPNMERRDNREQFDNHMNDRIQPNQNGGRDNREQFDNRMGNRVQPDQNRGRGNQNWGGQRSDNNRQNNFQQPNQNQGRDDQNRGGRGFERNNGNEQHQQMPNAGRENQDRGSNQPIRGRGGFDQKAA